MFIKLNILAFAILSALLTSQFCAAADFSVAGGAGYSSSPYKKYDVYVLPLPILSFDSKYFYMRGLGAGVHLWKDGQQTLSLGVSYHWQRFKHDKTDDRRLKQLSSRHDSINAELQYVVRGDYGRLKLAVFQDILDHSNGLSAEATYSYPFRPGKFYLSPGIGVRWESSDVLDYYYGISGKEASRSGLPRYKAEEGFSPFLFLESAYPLNKKWSLISAARAMQLSKEIKDSPMVDDTWMYSVFAGVNYSF